MLASATPRNLIVPKFVKHQMKSATTTDATDGSRIAGHATAFCQILRFPEHYNKRY